MLGVSDGRELSKVERPPRYNRFSWQEANLDFKLHEMGIARC